MSDLVAITLGNSTAALATVSAGALDYVLRVPVEKVDDLRPTLARTCPDCGSGATPIAVASVNPPSLERLSHLAAEMTLPRPEVAGIDFPIPLRVDVKQPRGVGVDRLLGALAAYRRTGGACIVVDFGTAITVNAVRRDGAFLGGAIFPGLAMMSRALAEGTALLPQAAPSSFSPSPLAGEGGGEGAASAPSPPIPAIGKDTEEAIAAGLLHGATGAVANLIIVASSLVGEGARIFLTGGDARRIAPLLPEDCRDISPNLVLEGLVIAYREWQTHGRAP